MFISLSFFCVGHTGAQLGELRALQWSDIDFENRKMYITKTAYDNKEGVKIKDITKNGHDWYIVIGRRLQAFLKEHYKAYKQKKEKLGKGFNSKDLVF